MNKLEEFLKPTQPELFSQLCRLYKGSAVVSKENYILVPGEAPVMLLAHMDTVHTEPVRNICKTENGNILMSPQGIGGDDRCGVFALVTAHKAAVKKPWLLFTCNEEVGGIGARAFSQDCQIKDLLPAGLSGLKLLIEIDRKGRQDAVYYDCENTEFEDYITSKGFKTSFGSFSDISVVAPALGVAAVNLSSGYYNAHTLHEYINRKHLNATIKKVGEIIVDACAPDFPKYEYVEAAWPAAGRGFTYYGGGSYAGWYGGGRHFGGSKGSGKNKKGKTAAKPSLYEPAEEDYEPPFDLPAYYADMWRDLLDYYTPAELEDLRAEMGDSWIELLWNDTCYDEYEFAGDYTPEERAELEEDEGATAPDPDMPPEAEAEAVDPPEAEAEAVDPPGGEQL